MCEHKKIANSKLEVDGTTTKLVDYEFLVAESDPKIAKIVLEHIRLNQGAVSRVVNLDELTQQLILNKYDLVFLGESFVEQLRAVYPTRGSSTHLAKLVRRIKKISSVTKVIILTSLNHESPSIELVNAGIDDYLHLAEDIEEYTNKISASLQSVIGNNKEKGHSNIANNGHNKKISQPMYQSDSSREKLQLLHWVKSLPGCVLIVDHELTVVSANNNCEKMLSYPKRSMGGLSFSKLLPQKLYHEFVDAIQHPVNGNKTRISEMVIDSIVLNAQTDGIPVQCIVKPLRLSSIKGYTISLQDISWQLDQKAAQIMQCRWQQLMSEFAQKFIIMPVKEFSTVIKGFLKKSAVMLTSERVYMYRLDPSCENAYLSFEWLTDRHPSLRTFSRKISISKRSSELRKLMAGEALLLEPLEIIKATKLSQPLGLSEHLAQVNSVSSYIVPLKNKSQVYGWIGFDIQRSGRKWQRSEMFNINELGQVINRAMLRKKYEDMRHLTHLKLIETHGRLSEQACLDSLTQIANRRYFDQIVKTEFGRAARDKSYVSLVLCDIDFFKEYNDAYGHVAGDLCLQRIARNLESSFKRAADFIARYGGEEFVIVLPGLDCKGAYEAAEKMRSNLFELNIPHTGSPIGRVTISVGLTCVISPAVDSVKEITERADKALYRAKFRGKNRVFIYESRRNTAKLA